MGGANYMGGKRNFVKARAKDATGKAQRNHFGKQRLGILAKGLSKAPLEKSSSAASVVHAVSRISLAHAKRDFQIQPRSAPPSEDGSLSHLQTLGLSSLYHRQHTPDRSSRTSDKSASHSSARSSRILDVLSVSVPISLRAEMDRIRRIPNLAGLAPRTERRPHLADYGGANGIAESSPPHSERPRKKRRTTSNSSIRSSSGSVVSPHDVSDCDLDTTRVVVKGSDFVPSKLSEGHSTYSSPTHHQSRYISPHDFAHLAHTEPDFEPVPLDSSSPMSQRFEDSGFSEFLSTPGPSTRQSRKSVTTLEIHQSYEPVRYSFYGELNSFARSPCARFGRVLASTTLYPVDDEASLDGPYAITRSEESLAESNSLYSPLGQLRASSAIGLDSLASDTRIFSRAASSPSPSNAGSGSYFRPHDTPLDVNDGCPSQRDGDLNTTALDEHSDAYCSDPSCPSGCSIILSNLSGQDLQGLPRSVIGGLPAAVIARRPVSASFESELCHASPLPGSPSTAPNDNHPPAADEPDDGIVEETLFDVLHGRLFEGADPWHALDVVLGLQSDSSSSMSFQIPPQEFTLDAHTEYKRQPEASPQATLSTLAHQDLPMTNLQRDGVALESMAVVPDNGSPHVSDAGVHNSGRIDRFSSHFQADTGSTNPESTVALHPAPDNKFPCPVKQDEISGVLNMPSGIQEISPDLGQYIPSDAVQAGVLRNKEGEVPLTPSSDVKLVEDLPRLEALICASHGGDSKSTLVKEDIGSGPVYTIVEGPCLFAGELMSDEE